MSSTMLNGSHIIKGRWKIIKKIGQGAFGEIHQAKNIITSEMVAIKLERVDSKKQVLKLEVAVLKKLQDCQYVCRFITCGRFAEYNYLVMELLGENLSELRRKQSDGKFSLATTIKLGRQMLSAIEASHELGYLHRDIKPSNFVMGGAESKRQTVFMIDFGLARRFLLNNGEVRPARDSTGFRGTARYASINSHLSKDLGRRDDLWSLFYVLVEFSKGSLPWRKIKDKDQIGEMKMQHNTPELVADLPIEFLHFMQYLQKLEYHEKPDYNYLQSLLSDVYHKVGADENTLFDWEIPPSNREVITSSTASQRSQPLTHTTTQYSKEQDKRSGKETGSGKGSSKGKEMNEAKEASESLRYQSNSQRGSVTPKGTIKGLPEFTANSPLMSGNSSKSPVYISSNVDSMPDESHKNSQHRRSSSLPVNLPRESSSNQNGTSVANNGSAVSPFRKTKTKSKKSKGDKDIVLDVFEKGEDGSKEASKMDASEVNSSSRKRDKDQCCKGCTLI